MKSMRFRVISASTSEMCFMLAGISLSFQGVKIKSWFIDGHCVLLENGMNKLIVLYYYLKSFERK